MAAPKPIAAVPAMAAALTVRVKNFFERSKVFIELPFC
jgi:hypothetical protein